MNQPTPPSSLEEARTDLRAAEHRWATYLATAQERSEIIAALDKATADLEAAARAEVIREVEAVGRAYSRNTGEGLLVATIVRALSQGGEGASQ